MSLKFILRLIGMVLGGIGGWRLGVDLAILNPGTVVPILVLTMSGAILIFVIIPYLTIIPFLELRRLLRVLAFADLLAGIFGLVAGLFITALVALPLAFLPDLLGHVLPFAVAVLIIYLSVGVAISRRRDLSTLLGKFRRQKLPATLTANISEPTLNRLPGVLVDSSALMDGRITLIAASGFLRARLVVPRFILTEVQENADVSDRGRRNRARYALEQLKTLQKSGGSLEILSDPMLPDKGENSAIRLIRLAQRCHHPIVTADPTFARMGSLQGVQILNVHLLAQALQPHSSPS